MLHTYSNDKLNYKHILYFSGNLEGEREKRDIKTLIDNPQLKFSGLYQR